MLVQFPFRKDCSLIGLLCLGLPSTSGPSTTINISKITLLEELSDLEDKQILIELVGDGSSDSGSGSGVVFWRVPLRPSVA